jgi:hypothetical protein
MTAVIERPLDLTTSVRDVSVTERGAFRTCRRRWYLETIENLEPRGSIQWNLEFGTGVHSGLEAFYKAFADIIDGEPITRAHEGFAVWYEDLDRDLRTLGPLADPLRDELLEMKNLGDEMLDFYNEYAVENDKYFVPLWIEGEPAPLVPEYLPGDVAPPYAKKSHGFRHESGRILVPIVHPVTKRRIVRKDGTPHLSARLDVVLFRKEIGLRGFWILDHKTTSSAPSDRGIDFEDQITGYCYVFWRLTGIIPRGTIFNYLVKQLPKQPRLVYNDTKLSSAKDQMTLPEWYEAAMHRFKVMDSPAHKECLASLKAYGWRRFFERFEVQRNFHELMRFEERLYEEYHDMFDAYKDPARRAYPNQSTMHCPNCKVNRICQSIEDGSDYLGVIESGYRQAKDRKAK